MSFRDRCGLLIVSLACAPLVACSAAVRKPHLLHPGPASFQRYNATQFDPYPQNDMGPKIVGGRPPDYAIPPDEVKRSRQFTDGRPGSATSLPVAVPGAAIVGAPASMAPISPTPPVVGPAIPVAPATPAIPTGPPITYRY